MMRYINILFFAIMIVMNYLANALPLNGKTTGELSDAFPNLFVPAGLTFSIWGVIYLLLLVFCVTQFTSSNQAVMSRMGWFFAVSCIFNALWIVAWHYDRLPFSLILMLGLLASLIWINIIVKDLPYGLIKAAFGIYLGWICIATIANITAILVSNNWSGFGISGETWTVIMIIAGALITVLALWKLDNPFIGLSVVWAFTGIMIKRQVDYRTIFIVAGVALAVVAIMLLLAFFKKRLPGLA
jgi:hypothetical protein